MLGYSGFAGWLVRLEYLAVLVALVTLTQISGNVALVAS